MPPFHCRPKVNAVKPHLALVGCIQVGVGLRVPSVAAVLRLTQKLPGILNVVRQITKFSNLKVEEGKKFHRTVNSQILPKKNRTELLQHWIFFYKT